ncbi:uncharacterized protein LOC111057300 [Nilaparvata lugens]|uniref:uncharacterized protein LOC111057300 n=1 Tax=Nilaparvata lugens TaxID=108931 RepID=UPI00193D28F0|nr:uncharacterized protein LOC111057300 [Nilaparvata lugens]
MESQFSPHFKLPFADFGNFFVSHQDFGPCAKMEMQALNCLEAYGRVRAQEKCADLISDFKECFHGNLQYKRMLAMRLERHRQYYMGEREQHFAPSPKSGSF